jgi:hypothetical protein
MSSLVISLVVLVLGWWVARKVARLALTLSVVAFAAHAAFGVHLPNLHHVVGLVHHVLGV